MDDDEAIEEPGPACEGGDDVDDAVADARNDVIAAMEQAATMYGLPRSAGRIYGLLYFAEEPLSLDDLAERSGYAKSTVSDVTGSLEDIYFARRVSGAGGGRKSFFEAERDIWYAMRQAMQDAGRREVELMRRTLSESEAELERALDAAERADDAARAATVATTLEHVRDLQALYRQIAVTLELFEQLPVEKMLGILARFADDVDQEDLPDSVDGAGAGVDS
jgi:DNA-binding transcriptional regulator GbsR (MarR family)